MNMRFYILVAALAAESVAHAQARPTAPSQAVVLDAYGIKLELPTRAGLGYRASKNGDAFLVDRAGRAVAVVSPTVFHNCGHQLQVVAEQPSLRRRGWQVAFSYRDQGKLSYYACALTSGRWPAIQIHAATYNAQLSVEQLFDIMTAARAAMLAATPGRFTHRSSEKARATHPAGWGLDLRRSPNNWQAALLRPGAASNSVMLERRGPIDGLYGAIVVRDESDLQGVLRCTPLAASEVPQGARTHELRPGLFVPWRSSRRTGSGGTGKQAWLEVCAATEDGYVYTLGVIANDRKVEEVHLGDIEDVLEAFADTVFPPAVATTPATNQPAPHKPSSTTAWTSHASHRRKNSGTIYRIEYRSADDPALVNDLEGILSARATAWMVGGSSLLRAYAELGYGVGGGVGYDFGLEYGLGTSAGGMHLNLISGVAINGVSDGKIESGWDLPLGVELTLPLGRTASLRARAASHFVLSADSRNNGSDHALLGDELSAFAGVRLTASGLLLGATYYEQMSTSFIGVAVGR